MAGRPDGGWLRAAPYRQFQQWCLQTYGDAGKTKTVTRRKYERIVQLLRGGEPASGDSAKFKFWVKSKGFQLATGNAVHLSLPGDNASARLYVPVKPPVSVLCLPIRFEHFGLQTVCFPNSNSPHRCSPWSQGLLLCYVVGSLDHLPLFIIGARSPPHPFQPCFPRSTGRPKHTASLERPI